jgi:penicillin-binding protein 2
VLNIFKEEGAKLHVITGVMALGMFVLLSGLWFVQIVRAKQFETDLKKQSIRHVRTPAIRGRILDRNGVVLAQDKPRYSAILYLEDLRRQFDHQYSSLRAAYTNAHPESVNNKGKVSLPAGVKRQLQMQADCDVVSNITWRVSCSLGTPRLLNDKVFIRHYHEHPYVPFPIVPGLDDRQVAVLSEQWLGQPAVEMETRPVRDYPRKSLAANLLGYVRHRDAAEDEAFSFDMPDDQGVSGVEYVYDSQLRGRPGDESVLINNLNYRQRVEVETPNQPGEDVYLTIDATLQHVAEVELARAPALKPIVRGAVIVMDPRNGDILALASAPTFDPDVYEQDHMSKEDAARLNDATCKPQFNRAVTGAYPPGSTFKIITAIACLETGLDPDEVYDSPGVYQAPHSRPIRDTAGPGLFNFEQAFYRSSNTYFIVKGKDRLRKILEVAKRFHLGEKTGISTHQEVAGDVPGPEMAGPNLGMSAADICIGQEITASPLQCAGMICAIANGGTLYVPRVVNAARSPDTGEVRELVAPGQVRDRVRINPRDLAIIQHAMLQDTEHPPGDGPGPGTAYKEFHYDGGAPKLGNFRVAGKTGTAEVKSPGSAFNRVTWFDSYAPFEAPRYVVIVMVEDGSFGGPTCAPVAEKIYEAILKREQSGLGRPGPLARN